MHLITALESTNGYQFFNSSNYGLNNSQTGAGSQGACCSIENFFFDYKPGWGPGWAFRLGRFANDAPCGGHTRYPFHCAPCWRPPHDHPDPSADGPCDRVATG